MTDTPPNILTSGDLRSVNKAESAGCGTGSPLRTRCPRPTRRTEPIDQAGGRRPFCWPDCDQMDVHFQEASTLGTIERDDIANTRLAADEDGHAPLGDTRSGLSRPYVWRPSPPAV